MAASLGACDQTQRAADCGDESPPVVADGFREPDVRISESGVLETTLRASYGPVAIGGREYRTMNYEGSVPGPTLVVCPGDRLVVHLENDLGDTPAAWLGGVSHEPDVPHGEGQFTNLHTHGLHVSPSDNSDNVFLSIPPGETFTYEYEIPDDHPPGMYWYHPHRHGFVEPQVSAGLLGVIYVQGGLDTLPALADIPTRTLVITSQQLRRGVVVPVQDTKAPKLYVNGDFEPEIAIRPGEIQRWRILNGTGDEVIPLSLEAHRFHVLANDGNTLQGVSPDDTLLMGPGERREVLVQGGAAGAYHLRVLPFTQLQGSPTPGFLIATMRSSGEEGQDEVPNVALPSSEEDLREADVDNHHRIVYTEHPVKGPNGFEFLFNGQPFDENRIDETMRLGEVSEWTLVNQTTEWHTFHIHINDFQVVAFEPGRVADVSHARVRDVKPRTIDPEDTVKIPPGSVVTVRTRPTDFTGRYVFHCHMLFHEDRGMMGVVQTVSA